jgi:hypothetical protein
MDSAVLDTIQRNWRRAREHSCLHDRAILDSAVAREWGKTRKSIEHGRRREFRDNSNRHWRLVLRAAIQLKDGFGSKAHRDSTVRVQLGSSSIHWALPRSSSERLRTDPLAHWRETRAIRARICVSHSGSTGRFQKVCRCRWRTSRSSQSPVRHIGRRTLSQE